MNPDTDIVIQFGSPEQKQAFVQFMQGEGTNAICDSAENKALEGSARMESVDVQDESEEEDGSECNYIVIE
jgi:hypothetical protein